MPSNLELVNFVRAELGQEQISALNVANNGIFISNQLALLHAELLLSYEWNFAVVYREDSTPLVSAFSPDFRYAYQLPSNYGRFYRWSYAGANWYYYAIYDNQFLTNVMPLTFYYIVNNVAYEILPPLYTRALVEYTASKVSLSLTNNVQLTQYLAGQYQNALLRAILQNDNERAIVQMPYNDFNRTIFV